MPCPHYQDKAPVEASEIEGRELAIQVIVMALKDYVQASTALRGRCSNNRHIVAEQVRDETLDFLTGQTKIAEFWFSLARLPFVSKRRLDRACQIDGLTRTARAQVTIEMLAAPMRPKSQLDDVVIVSERKEQKAAVGKLMIIISRRAADIRKYRAMRVPWVKIVDWLKKFGVDTNPGQLAGAWARFEKEVA